MIKKIKSVIKSPQGKWIIVSALISVLLIYFAVNKLNTLNHSSKGQGYETYRVEKVKALKL